MITPTSSRITLFTALLWLAHTPTIASHNMNLDDMKRKDMQEKAMRKVYDEFFGPGYYDKKIARDKQVMQAKKEREKNDPILQNDLKKQQQYLRLARGHGDADPNNPSRQDIPTHLNTLRQNIAQRRATIAQEVENAIPPIAEGGLIAETKTIQARCHEQLKKTFCHEQLKTDKLNLQNKNEHLEAQIKNLRSIQEIHRKSRDAHERNEIVACVIIGLLGAWIVSLYSSKDTPNETEKKRTRRATRLSDLD